jgi:N-acetylglucosaminyldiphosphoundecaprenol N-acetyl-beta-D-mannosaminyltransferase
VSVFSDIAGGAAGAKFPGNEKPASGVSALKEVASLSGESNLRAGPRKFHSEAEFSSSWFLSGLEFLILVTWNVAAEVTYYRLALNQIPDIAVIVATGAIIALSFCGSKRIFHSKQRITSRRKLQSTLQTFAYWCGSFLILTLLIFSFHISAEVSRGAVFSLFFSGPPVLFLARGITMKLFATHLYENSLRGRDVVLVGGSRRALADATEVFLARGCSAPAVVKVEALCPDDAWSSELGRSILQTTKLAHKAGPGALYICAQNFPEDRLHMLLTGLRIIPRAIRIIPDAVTTHLLSFPMRNDVDGISMEVQSSPLTAAQRAVKRTFDVLVSAIFVALFLPLFVAIAFAIRLDSPGPMFFRQKRLGYRGRPFKIIKFRTMNVMEDGADVRHAVRNDPRVTRVGKFLRKTSLDEIPQFINVLSGAMSLVGPRPHAVAHDNHYAGAIQNYELRQHVKPGITGWAQVHGMRGDAASPDLMSRRVEYDIWYAKNASLALDVEILLRTIAVILGKDDVEDLRSPLKTSAEVTRVLGIPVDLINMQSAVATIISWARGNEGHYVCVRDVHGIMQAQRDAELRKIHEDAAMVTPDGMPLVWLSRLRADESVGRVCGSDLVDALCAASVKDGLAHYFYGGKSGVAELMATRLKAKYPGLKVVGTFCPPFGALPPDEDAAILEAISAAKPHVVWVGLSSPKQEYWMRDHVGRIPGATLIGVGAAFDFHTGAVARAPRWMQTAGLEWLHRLFSEPTRLWRRYIVMAPQFALRALGEQALPSTHAPGKELRFSPTLGDMSERTRLSRLDSDC